jgi:ParB family chromosome partitioning protein
MSSHKPAPRLGRGLSALVGTRPHEHAALATAPPVTEHPAPALVAIERIRPNPRQPRTHFDDTALAELAESIKSHGIVQPIVVRRAADGGFELIAGERRWRAAKLANLTHVPVVERHCGDDEAIELALIENIQREDLDPLERARAYQAYLTHAGGTPELLAQRLGQSRANVVNYMRLLNLSDEIQQMLHAGELAMGHARALLAVEDVQRRLALARLAVRKGLTAREVERLAQRPIAVPPAPIEPTGVDRHYAELENSMSKALGLKVKLIAGRKKNSGRVVIHFQSLDEFDRVAARLGIDSTMG